ncbi:X-linked retinitis pigmentosa GTPase regulator isoform X1 [Balamuthia mandrillaris]
MFGLNPFHNPLFARRGAGGRAPLPAVPLWNNLNRNALRGDEEEEEEEEQTKRLPPRKPFQDRSTLSEWTNRDVLDWYESKSVGLCAAFPEGRHLLKANQIDGQALLAMTSETMLLMGFEEESHRQRLLSAVDVLRSSKQLREGREETRRGEEEGEERGAEAEEGEEREGENKKRKREDGEAEEKTEEQKKDKGKEKEEGRGEESAKKKTRVEKEEEEEEEEKGKRGEGGVTGTVECPVCMDDVEYGDAHSLARCHHTYCKLCLQQYFMTKVSSKEFPILCPDPKCKTEVLPTDAKAVLDQDSLDKFERFSLSAMVEKNQDMYSCCPTPGCSYVFVWMKGDDPHFRCEKCRKHYCLSCKTEWHKELSCLQMRRSAEWALLNMKADALFEELVTGRKYKQCPECRFWVGKSVGCNSMSCRCGTHFCYACGSSSCDGYSCPQQNEAGEEDEDEEDY